MLNGLIRISDDGGLPSTPHNYYIFLTLAIPKAKKEQDLNG